MNTESSEKLKVIILGDFASKKPKKQETPYDKVQRIIRQRTGEVVEKIPTNLKEWKREKKLSAETNEEVHIPPYEKLHLDKTEDQWEKYFNDYIDEVYGDDIEFCYEEYEAKDQFIYKYFSNLIYELASDGEYGQEVIAGIKNLEKLERGKYKGDVGIYLFLANNYQSTDNVTDEIKRCYLKWYNEDKKNNKVGLYISQKLSNFLPIIYSISKDIPMFKYAYEMDEGYNEGDEDDYE